jgi:uncharacterized DUF497 family protein
MGRQMKVTFHEAKRSQTLVERGLDFADAELVFASPSFTLEDDRKDYGERRYQTIGYLHAELVTVVWTPRGGATHVISMRKCNDRERRTFADRLG